MILQQGFPQFDRPFVDVNTGRIQQPWMQLLISLWNRTGQGPGASITDIELIYNLTSNTVNVGDTAGPDQAVSFLTAANAPQPAPDTIATSRIVGNARGFPGEPQPLTTSQALDFIDPTQGDVLYRGSVSWEALGPSTPGYVLSTNGPGADPSWVPGGSGGASWIPLVDGAEPPSLISDGAGHLVLVAYP